MLIKAIPVDVEHTLRNFSLLLMDLHSIIVGLYALAWINKTRYIKQ